MRAIKRFLLLAAALAMAPGARAATIEMEVNGLVCAFCAQGIARTLRGFEATAEVFVSLEDRIVAVALVDGSDIPDATLTTAIADAGYAVTAIHRSDADLASIRARVAAGTPRK